MSTPKRIATPAEIRTSIIKTLGRSRGIDLTMEDRSIVRLKACTFSVCRRTDKVVGITDLDEKVSIDLGKIMATKEVSRFAS
ncbi:hypothetical protein C0581_00625 [Candidatus Parcubacteria bacterium]|nr:MAG: hypothetical protein C0581_00625 [Candidatus Parcubacteria bacterium]